MKDQKELKRLARMVLDGSARIADLRRMAELVLAGDEVVVRAPPIVGTVGGKTTTMLDWLNAAFASGSPGTAPPFVFTAPLSAEQALAAGLEIDRG